MKYDDRVAEPAKGLLLALLLTSWLYLVLVFVRDFIPVL